MGSSVEEQIVVVSLADLERSVAELVDVVKALINDQRRPLAVISIPAGATIRVPFQLRATAIILTASAAATITLNKGSEGWAFPFAAADTKVLPLPIVISSGLDLSISASAGTGAGWIVGTADPLKPSRGSFTQHNEIGVF